MTLAPPDTPQYTDQGASQFDLMSIKAGDIIFVRPKSSGLGRLIQFINVQGQHFLAKVRRSGRLHPMARVRKYSHVMLGVGDGLIIHADGKTVALEVASDALDFVSTTYQVFRHPDLSLTVASDIAKSGMRYMQQKYSFKKYFGKYKEADTTQFCSRLVAHAYRAADIPLTRLQDNDVLPIDLYLLCQEPPWTDVTAQTVAQPVPPDLENLLGQIDVPERGTMSIGDFFKETDALLLDATKNHKKFQELQCKVYGEMIRAEALLMKFCAAVFTQAKQYRLKPNKIDDDFAEKICRVLSQIDILLDLAALPDVDLLVGNTLINTATDGRSAYAGMPAPRALREMQTGGETIRIYTYFIMAEIGLFGIVAKDTPHEKIKSFEGIKSEYVARFLAALPSPDTLPAREIAETAFAWIEDGDDRALCRAMYKNIDACLEILSIRTGTRRQ